MASVWCCVQICSLLTQCCLSLASEAAWNKNKEKNSVKSCYRHYRTTWLCIHLCILLPSSAADDEKHPDQYWVNLMEGKKWVEKQTMVWCTVDVFRTHPWACTVPHWWHWRWMCASLRHLGRWRLQPEEACRGASGAVTAHWQNIPAGQLHCLGQKTWKQPTTMTKSSSATNQHGIYWIRQDWSNELLSLLFGKKYELG